jgi:hypothetical protein
MISRFSTLCYESLARGVDLAYHNPHGELAAPFAEPGGAFRITRTRDELLEVVREPTDPAAVRGRAAAFLACHLMLDDPAPQERAATRIIELLT